MRGKGIMVLGNRNIGKQLEKNKTYLYLIVFAIVADYIQYDSKLSSHIYIVIFFLIYIFIKILKKDISVFFVFLFSCFLVYSDKTRYFYEDLGFSSVFRGSFKYLFVIMTLVIMASKIRKKHNIRFFLYLILTLFYLLISLIQNNPLTMIIPDFLLLYFLLILPHILNEVFSSKDAIKIIKIFDCFTSVFPILFMLLLVLQRYNHFFGAYYIFVDAIPVIGLAALIGEVKYRKKKKKIEIVAIILYIIIIIAAPSSGTIIMMFLLFLFLFRVKTFLIPNIKKIVMTVFLFLLIFAGIEFNKNNLILDSKMLTLKIMQIKSLKNLNKINMLPFSVQVRVAEVLNIIDDNKGINMFFGKGFGGFFEQNKIRVDNLDETAFTNEEIRENKFYRAHFFLSNFYLKFGIIGILIFFEYFYFSYLLLKKHKKSYIPILLVVIYASFWGIKVVVLWAFILGAVLNIDNYKKKEGSLNGNETKNFNIS